jgi:glyoxalase/bleomycin resistance protein/dioxygenase superfamily protein
VKKRNRFDDWKRSGFGIQTENQDIEEKYPSVALGFRRRCYSLRRSTGGGAAILGHIDHVRIGVSDLKAGITAYRRIGFELDERGIARNEGDRLELVRGKEGLQSIALASDDLAADSSRGSADYVELVEPKNAQAASRHPNGVQRIERVYIAVSDLKAAAEKYSRVLGVAPKMERGTVIHADMAIFQIGATALGLAQPAAPGVCADALERRGPGPFQILYRTSSMDAAAKWMAGHGVPPPARGIRNTGEQAMLVLPEYACGVYIGFVGPA